MALKVSGTTVIDDNRNIVSGTTSVKGSVVSASTMSAPRGTTAQRPASPVVGQVFFDTDEGRLKAFNGTAWV